MIIKVSGQQTIMVVVEMYTKSSHSSVEMNDFLEWIIQL